MASPTAPLAFITLSFFAFTIAGCGGVGSKPVTDPALTECSPNVAQIAVYDGIFQNLCGCAEPAGTAAAAPTPLTCTVSAGTTVLFHFLGNSARHQIVSTGTPSFNSSPLTDPFDEVSDPPYGVPFATPGTYQFQDALMPAMTGQITVI